jgi:hypothetical protein
LSEIRRNSSFSQGCHLISHVIASEEVAKANRSWEEIIAKVPVEDCGGGFIMGAIEGQQLFNQEFRLDEHTIPLVCEKTKQQASNVNTDQMCTHIMGHLVLVELKGNVEKATNVCSKTNFQSKYECLAGVFMENLLRRNLVAHGVGERFAWNEETLQAEKERCSEYSGQQANACWRELSHMIVYISRANPNAVFSQCSIAPNTTMQTECYIHAVGLMTQSTSFQRDDLSRLCMPYQGDKLLFSRCITMAINTIDTNSSHLKPFIRTTCDALNELDKQDCYATISI